MARMEIWEIITFKKKTESMRPHWKHMCKLEDSIKMDLKQDVCVCVCVCEIFSSGSGQS
jgi:hypothetical protein